MTEPKTPTEDKPGGTQSDVAAEAKHAKVRVVWRDLDFEISRHRDDWTYEGILAIETGRRSVAIREFLTVGAYRKFLESNPKGSDMDSLFDAIVEAMGLSRGD